MQVHAEQPLRNACQGLVFQRRRSPSRPMVDDSGTPARALPQTAATCRWLFDLRDAAPDDRISATRDRPRAARVGRLRRLVAAKTEPGGIFRRLTRSRGRPRCAVSRFIGSSGVGRLARPRRFAGTKLPYARLIHVSRPLGRRDDKQNDPHRYGQPNRQGD